MKRYARQIDELASKEAVNNVLQILAARVALENLSDEKLVKLANSIHNFLKYRVKTNRGGRPGAFERPLLNRAAEILTEILDEATGGRVSRLRFLSRYLPILNFPADITEALAAHQITLEEAHLVARLSPRNLKGDGARAKRLREDVLAQHYKFKFSQPRLRQRVAEILGEIPVKTVEELSQNIKEQVAETDALLEIDAYDTTHLMFEEIKNLFYIAREIEDEDLDDELIDEILNRTGELQAILQTALKRKSKRLIDNGIIHPAT